MSYILRDIVERVLDEKVGRTEPGILREAFGEVAMAAAREAAEEAARFIDDHDPAMGLHFRVRILQETPKP